MTLTARGALRLLLVHRAAMLLALLAGLVAVNGALVPGFLTFGNLAGSTAFGVEVGILALAELAVILTGDGAIDLSVGSMVSVAGVVLGIATVQHGLPLAVAVPVTIAAGVLLGAVNGFFVAVLHLPALIVTLGTLFGYASLALVLSDAMPISGLPAALEVLVLDWYGVPHQTLWVYVPVVIAVWVLLRGTVFGRNVYAVGVNGVAARFAGVPVTATRFGVFALSGALAGVVAVVTSARFASARPDAGTGLELQAITIAVLGGVAITGGAGAVGPVVIATALVTVVNNGMNLAAVDAIWQHAALGAVLLASAMLYGFAVHRYGTPGRPVPDPAAMRRAP